MSDDADFQSRWGDTAPLYSAKEPTMTDEQMNLAICKLRGWTDIRHYPVNNHWWARNPKNGDLDFLPQHVEGIEALGHMHEAEMVLTEDQQLEYRRHLDRIVDCTFPKPYFLLIHANAKQRAEAFLRTVNLYT